MSSRCCRYTNNRLSWRFRSTLRVSRKGAPLWKKQGKMGGGENRSVVKRSVSAAHLSPLVLFGGPHHSAANGGERRNLLSARFFCLVRRSAPFRRERGERRNLLLARVAFFFCLVWCPAPFRRERGERRNLLSARVAFFFCLVRCPAPFRRERGERRNLLSARFFCLVRRSAPFRRERW